MFSIAGSETLPLSIRLPHDCQLLGGSCPQACTSVLPSKTKSLLPHARARAQARAALRAPRARPRRERAAPGVSPFGALAKELSNEVSGRMPGRRARSASCFFSPDEAELVEMLIGKCPIPCGWIQTTFGGHPHGTGLGLNLLESPGSRSLRPCR